MLKDAKYRIPERSVITTDPVGCGLLIESGACAITNNLCNFDGTLSPERGAAAIAALASVGQSRRFRGDLRLAIALYKVGGGATRCALECAS